MSKNIRPFSIWLVLFVAYAAYLSVLSNVLASATSSFNQTITAGTLSVDIVDGSYVSVGSPSVTMSPVTFSFSCQNATGTFGTATQQIYVTNPDAADAGWNVTLDSVSTAAWVSAGLDMDFNDPNTTGCGDGTDADSYKGQLTVDPSVGTLAVGQCDSCVVTNVSKGTSSSYDEETATNSITVLTGAAGSDDIGDWTLQGVSLLQKIPGEQPAAADYSISLTLTII